METFIDKEIRKSDFVKMAGLSPYVIKKFSHNENVNAETLAKICKALNCTFDDIMEINQD